MHSKAVKLDHYPEKEAISTKEMKTQQGKDVMQAVFFFKAHSIIKHNLPTFG